MYPLLDTTYVRLEIRDDILYATYHQNRIIDLKAAEQIVSERLAFTNNRRMLAIIFTEGNVDIKQSAREFILSDRGTEGLIACALIKDSPVAAVLISLYIALHSPWRIPVKSFSRESSGLRWLRKQKNLDLVKHPSNG